MKKEDNQAFQESESYKKYREALLSLLGKEVEVKVDRPLGSAHPKFKQMIYPVNYGYVESLLAPDGDYQDAYILGVNQPLDSYVGEVIAIVERSDDVEGKLIVAPKGKRYLKQEIEEAIYFQERYFKHTLLMAKQN